MLVTILLVFVGLIVLLLVVAAISRKKYTIEREVVIAAPVHKVFDYVKQLKNQDNFNKWVMADPAMQRNFKGTDGTIGFVYGWNGNKQAGEGELEIKAIEDQKSITTEIRFVRPFKSVAHVVMKTEPTQGGPTRVTWSNAGEMKYPLNLMLGMIEKMLGKDMGTSLNNLKVILEQ